MTAASTTMPHAAQHDDAPRRQIANATLRLRRYRLARDRARMERLQSEPHLFELIAGLLKPQV